MNMGGAWKPMPTRCELTIGQCATLACLLEVSAPKPGNVHAGADFEDMTYQDFLLSAVAIGPAMERAAATGIGIAVRDAIAARRALTPVNTNLRTLLLLAPLAAVPRDLQLARGIRDVLARLDASDSEAVYQAIRMAAPGGLGRVAKMDINAPPPPNLRAAMQAAAERDLVARQFVTDFGIIFEQAVPSFVQGVQTGLTISEAIVHSCVQLLAEYGDSLIARKCGQAVSDEARRRAGAVLAAGMPGDKAYERTLSELDRWLRADGHQRNPGTIADLIAAALFVVLRDELLPLPRP